MRSALSRLIETTRDSQLYCHETRLGEWSEILTLVDRSVEEYPDCRLNKMAVWAKAKQATGAQSDDHFHPPRLYTVSTYPTLSVAPPAA